MIRPLPASALLLFLVAAGVTPNAASAQQPPAEATDDKAQAQAVREQTIYIPYTKLREVFEKEGRGVYLPYEKFQELWKAAREKTAPLAEAGPPVNALISEAENEATVERDVVHVKARLKIELLAEGWSEVPLRLSDAAIRSAKIGNQPARIAVQPDGSYMLLVKKDDKQPQQIELALEYSKAFTKTPGQNSVAFQAPQAPVNRWRITIPQSGVKVNIFPLLAATEAPTETASKTPADAGDGDTTPDNEQTVVLAFVGAAPEVRIDWTPKAEGAAGLAALATVQAEQEVTIDEGVIRTRTRLQYDINRAELSQLLVEVPADQKVAGVFDPNVRQWEVETLAETQKITVQLFEAAQGVQNITVELEKFSDDIGKQDVTVPVVKALGVSRQQGIVVVRLGSALRAETASQTGLLQLDAADLPSTLARGQWAFSYRYAALPFELAFDVEKVQPRIVVDELVEAYLEPEQLTLDLLALYNIERAGVFQLELDVPAGYELRQVRGQAAAGAEAAAVDTYHLEEDDKTRLIVNLSRKAIGKVGLFVELQRRLDDANLLTPTGKASDITLALPRVAAGGVERSTGRLVVYAPESLRVSPVQHESMRSLSFSEAFEGTESTRGPRFPMARAVLAFAYSSGPASLVVSAERRMPYVTVRQLLVVGVESGVVKYSATFFYDIQYSGVKSLRIDLPERLLSQIRNRDTSIYETTTDPPPDDLAEGYIARSFTGETEWIGQATIHLTWESKMDELDVGKSVALDIPYLRPMSVDRAWGQIALTKAETIDVQPSTEPRGLRPIDPQHDLMEGADVADAAGAFEFHDDWQLNLTATRYELEEVKHTSIERAVLRMVVNRKAENDSQKTAVQALYRLRSVRQRLVVKLPDKVQFDSEPLRIDGRPVTLERGDQGEYYVPLVGHSPDQPLLLELRYITDSSQARLDFPEFPDEPAIQKVYLAVYLPEELALVGWHGPWSDELTWYWDHWLNTVPLARRGSDELLSWVTEGISVTDSPAFQTDGTLYVFSTLRPPAPPTGSLRLRAFSERWLDFLIFAAVIAVGVALLGQNISRQFSALAVLLITLVLCGVFLPTFARQVIDGKLLFAVVIVLAIWATRYIVQARSNNNKPDRGAPTSPFASNSPDNPAPPSTTEPVATDPPPTHHPPTESPAEGDKTKGGSSDA